tara:strand:+ start:1805 stop:2257 length:453 start_codon:yes stop_codon:yes gene_type:complete
MLLIEKINIDLKQAMLDREKLKLESLRAIKASLILNQTSVFSQDKMSKEDEIKILQKLVKQRRESANIYTNQKRPELAKIEQDQADFISSYLPKQLTNQEIEVIVSKVILESNSNGLKDMGKVIAEVVKSTLGRADGKTISNIVKQKLSD